MVPPMPPRESMPVVRGALSPLWAYSGSVKGASPRNGHPTKGPTRTHPAIKALPVKIKPAVAFCFKFSASMVVCTAKVMKPRKKNDEAKNR